MPEPREGSTVSAEPSMRAILEALLYASPDPVGLDELKEAFGADRAGEVDAALGELMEEYRGGSRGLMIEQVAGGYRIATRPELADVLREFVRRRNATRMSRAALETLSVIAYRQPVTAPEIEAIRGVNPSAILRSLLERRMVRIVGRKKVVGKPFLYGTTPAFLEHFGLNSLDDLPALDEFMGILDDAAPGGVGGTEGEAGRAPFASDRPGEPEGSDAPGGEPGEDESEEAS